MLGVMTMAQFKDRGAYPDGEPSSKYDAALDDTLARDRAFATLGILSGDRALSKFGEAKLRTADRSLRGRVHIGDGFMLDKATGRVEQDPSYAQFLDQQEERRATRAAQSQADILARMGYGADLRRTAPNYAHVPTEGGQAILQTNPEASGGAGPRQTIPVTPPLGGDDRQKAAEAERLAVEAGELYDELRAVGGVVSSPKDIISDVINKVPAVGGGLSRAAQEQMFSPEQQRVRSRGARFEQNLSNLAAGLALTGYELEQRNRWSPFASGINQEEAQRRLANIQRDFGDRRDTILNAPRLQPGDSSPTRATKRVRVDAEGNILGD
jgi:hypothetical protein